MPTLHKTFPSKHETAYSVTLRRPEGERALGSIALNSDREFLWTFDGIDEQWHHHVAPHWEKSEYESGLFVSSENGIRVPPDLFVPTSPIISMYHIHPHHARNEDIEHFEVKNQLPSNQDIDACAKLCMLGYKDFRIVTPIGVTTMAVASSVIESRSVSIKAFTLKAQEVHEWERTDGVIGAIKLAVAYYASSLDNLISINFDEFSDI